MQKDEEQRIVTAGFAAVCLTSLAALTSFYLLLPTVPMFISDLVAHPSGAGMAGLATGALMLSTIGAELAAPRLLAQVGPRAMFAAALVLLAGPALLLSAIDSVAGVLAVCLVRGLGFGIAVVVGGALVAQLAPPRRRGEALGIYGAVVTIPAVGALPLGVWLVEVFGFALTFAIGGGVAAFGLLIVVSLRRPPGSAIVQVGMTQALRSATLRRPAVVFASCALAGGAVVTFLPLSKPAPSVDVIALALLVHALAATVGRWWAGRLGDRYGAARLLLPGVLLSAAGMLALLLLPSTSAVLLGMTVFGSGFGIVQNASFALMLDRVDTGGYGAVSGLWNLAWDVGLGTGAVSFGFVVALTGYPLGFALVAGLILATAPMILVDRTRISRTRTALGSDASPDSSPSHP